MVPAEAGKRPMEFPPLSNEELSYLLELVVDARDRNEKMSRHTLLKVMVALRELLALREAAARRTE
jgi:hypothetical protein